LGKTGKKTKIEKQKQRVLKKTKGKKKKIFFLKLSFSRTKNNFCWRGLAKDRKPHESEQDGP